jgi:NTE family protein
MRQVSCLAPLLLLAVAGVGCCSLRGPCQLPPSRPQAGQSCPQPEVLQAKLPASRPQAGQPCPQPEVLQAKYPFQNLVFEGGGVRGVAYAGALDVLDRAGILSQVKAVAGTSAGAITAALVALGYTPAEIKDIFLYENFNKFKDGSCGGLLRLFSRYGWYCGDYFLNLMQCLVERKTGSRHTTFAELERMKDRGFRELRVFATDLNSTRIIEYSAKCTPTMEVAKAVRMSMSIPLFFASIRQAGDVHVDGGVLLNYPIDTFDGSGDHPHYDRTLGMILVDLANQPPPASPINDLPQDLTQLFTAILAAESVELESDPFEMKRTISINDLGIAVTDFSLSPEQKCHLIHQGAGATCTYLAHWQEEKKKQQAEAKPLVPGVMRQRFLRLSNGQCATGSN